MAAAAPSNVSPLPALRRGFTELAGRLVQIRKGGQFFLHLVTMPAPDAYSSPQTVEILAEKPLGQKDDEIIVTVRIGGYRRSYDVMDPETGYKRKVFTADNKFYAVEG